MENTSVWNLSCQLFNWSLKLRAKRNVSAKNKTDHFQGYVHYTVFQFKYTHLVFLSQHKGAIMSGESYAFMSPFQSHQTEKPHVKNQWRE